MDSQNPPVPARQPESPPPVSFKNFLEGVPPGVVVTGADVAKYRSGTQGTANYLDLPAIELFCTHAACEDVMFFDSMDRDIVAPQKAPSFRFLSYRCRHCKATAKVFALRIGICSETSTEATLFKFGEDFPFGRPTPRKVLDLMGAERNYYLKGRRAENLGLGIAAFAYYRRVVENQKGAILQEFMKAAERIGAPTEMVADLKAAAKETQFSKALEAIKHGIPAALLIDGHNPLFLLHNALSDGLHLQDDERCLELATSIRVVLFDIVERVGMVLKDQAELKSAVGKLLAVSRPAAGK